MFLELEGAAPDAQVTPLVLQLAKGSRFTGSEPLRWAPSQARATRLRVEGAYPDVSIEVYFLHGRLEYDVITSTPKALEAVKIRVEGARALRVTEDGSLSADLPLGPLLQRKPRAATEGAPATTIPCAYRVLGPRTFGFVAEDHMGALRIDPQLEYGTYLGGIELDEGYSITTDGNGACFVTGNTGSSDFPTTPGSFKTIGTPFGDAFITKLSPDGSQVEFSTFLGLGDMRAVALSPNGSVVAAGKGISTGIPSESFPTTPNAIYASVGQNSIPAFCVLSHDGAALLYGTYVGGGIAPIEDIYVDSLNRLYACGAVTFSFSYPFPLTPGPLGALKGLYDSMLMRFSLTSLAMEFGCAIGGSGTEGAFGLSVRSDGAAATISRTSSVGYPVTAGVPQPVNNSPLHDKLGVTVVSPSGASLEWSTFWGGTLPGSAFASNALACAFDSTGALTVAGTTATKDFPTTPGAFKQMGQGSPTIASDCFVSRFAPDGTSVQFSTLLLNAGANFFRDAIVAPDGTTLGTGFTTSPNYPVTPGALKLTPGGGASDPALARFSADGSAVLYGTFLGGGFDTAEESHSLAMDSVGAVYITGYTNSPNFPVTPGAFDTIYNNNGFSPFDCWIQKITPPVNQLPGLNAYGTGTPGCAGPHLLAAHSTPKLNNPHFALTCANAPRGANGILIYSSAPEPVGVDSLGIGALSHIQILGASLGWLDLSAPPQGTSTTKLPIPNSPHFLGLKVYAQAFWLWPASQPCPQLPFGLSSSNGLEIVIQN
ncbi:MAG: SBBP repeat-containing protein [Planctomycetes bacterium]|nr:SBBP repeat-containing protein [Planctomycetota bacterium]